jgi:predicted acyltransferase
MNKISYKAKTASYAVFTAGLFGAGYVNGQMKEESNHIVRLLVVISIIGVSGLVAFAIAKLFRRRLQTGDMDSSR